MPNIYKLAVKNNDPLEEMNNFFKSLLREKILDSLLVPQDAPNHKSVVQTLVRSEEEIKNANPFAPLLLMNSATLVGQLTFDKPKEKIGAVMRSCEIRATIELAKLKQVNMDNLIIIGVDCLGTYESKVYQRIAQKSPDTKTFTKDYLSDSAKAQANLLNGEELRLACRGCEYPNPENTDIAINFLGCDVSKEIFIQTSEKSGKINPEKLSFVPAKDTSKWEKASQSCRDRRTKFRDKLFQDVLSQIKDIKGFLKELEHCRRCYNCRKECPICYCRECIFDTLVFEHASKQYFNWAKKKGRIRMPTDTLLFHLTRMNHMVVSCVACGQCTSACPNDIPVAKFFKTIGFKVQELFDYKAGRNKEEEIPQATFKEDEFQEAGEPAEKVK